ncbi:MAG: bifunctional 4-hydroxy-2-oxoglutarate aldolase/2-dehydro-3-deoxy-phosphogluconate aldolase [Candidatus Sericytochromatia bacterium]
MNDPALFYRELQAQFLLPILRLDDPSQCLLLAESLYHSGFTQLEITLTTPDALGLIARLQRDGIPVGAGTVLTLQDAERALGAGAHFLVSPGLGLEIAALAREAGVPYIPGVYTPSEVMTALAHGLQQLKLFPASHGGLDYLNHLRGPFPQVQWLPTGGLAFADLPAWRRAGVLAVGQGSRLVPPELLRDGDAQALQAHLRKLAAEVARWEGPA